MTIRATPPGQRVCFAPEIQLYAALAALSPELWPPMVEAAPRDTTEQNMNRLVELARRRELRCPFWPAWSQAIGPAGPAWLHVVTNSAAGAGFFCPAPMLHTQARRERRCPRRTQNGPPREPRAGLRAPEPWDAMRTVGPPAQRASGTCRRTQRLACGFFCARARNQFPFAGAPLAELFAHGSTERLLTVGQVRRRAPSGSQRRVAHEMTRGLRRALSRPTLGRALTAQRRCGDLENSVAAAHALSPLAVEARRAVSRPRPAVW
jgi:hypothetical protein